MKVLFLCRLYWPHVGGVEKHVEKLCEILKDKHEITIVTEKYYPSLLEEDIKDGVEVRRLDASSKWSVWTWWISNHHLIRDVDVVHIHDVFWWILPLRFVYWNKKMFITFHGYEGSDPPRWNQVFWHWLGYKLTRGNICIGDFHTKWYFIKPDFVSYGAV